MIISKFILPIFILLLSLSSLASEQLYKAHDAYDKGDYAQAIEEYNKLSDDYKNSGEFHYNIGNFYFRNGERGKAIFHYKVAKELAPRDPDISFNLNYASEKNVDKIENSDSSLWDTFSLKSFLGVKERIYLISFISFIFWGLTIFLLFKRQETVRLIQRITLVIFILSVVVVAKDYLSSSDFGVITAEEAKVFSAIGKDNVLLFTLHEGTEFFINDEIDKTWMQIVLRDGKKGWIKSTQVISSI